MEKKKVKGIECKHITHRPKVVDEEGNEILPDTHYVKEKIHFEDGTYATRLRKLRNFKRPYWLTQPNKRQHQQFKECEKLENLLRFEATESDLKNEICQKLFNTRNITYREMRKLRASPYVYGTDINSKVFLRKKYLDTFPDLFTEYTVCSFDIETDIDTDEIIIISIAMEDRVFTTVSKKLFKGIDKPMEKLKALFKENIPLDREIDVKFHVTDDELELFSKVMEKVHEWKPDWLAVWNIDFDFTMVMKLCEKYGVRLEDYICDPELPKEERFYVYKKAKDSAVSASGVRKNTDMEKKWNLVLCPAQYHWIDAMSAYGLKRTNSKKIPTGYGLDSVLEFSLGKAYKKIKFKHLSKIELIGADYHRYMVKNHPLEYIIYNQWDVLSMLELDKVTNDLKFSIPVLSGVNPVDIFNSSPKKLVNVLLFEYLNEGYVIGNRDPSAYEESKKQEEKKNQEEEEEEEDDEVLSLRDWIITLPNKYLNERFNRKLVKGYKRLLTNIRLFVCDCDQKAGYPSDNIELNVSKHTTKCEIISIGDIPEELFKKENINLMFGVVNQMQYCQTMMNFPSLMKLEEEVKKLIEQDTTPK